MISLHYTSHTKAYNTIYTACNIVEAIYSFTIATHSHQLMNAETSMLHVLYVDLRQRIS